jgi:hypothetical protein
MTRLSSEPYCRRRRPPPSSYSGKPTYTSLPMNGLKTSSEEQSLHRQHHDATQTNNLTNVGRRGLVKKSTPPNRPPLAPEEGLVEANARWTTSSTCVPVPQRHAPHPPELQGLQALRRTRSTLPTSTTSPTSRSARGASTTSTTGRGEGGAFPRVDKEVNVIFDGHGSQESKRQQKLNDRQILMAATGPPAPY